MDKRALRKALGAQAATMEDASPHCNLHDRPQTGDRCILSPAIPAMRWAVCGACHPPIEP